MKFQTTLPIEYPETDGRPVGEKSDLHRQCVFCILDLLKQRHDGQRVYISGYLLVYYEEEDPTRYVVPDAMVVKDCDPGLRRVFKIWEEGRAPNVVFETTSRLTKNEDSISKPRIYEQLGVGEYFLYDSMAEYLHPPLQGHQLTDASYEPIEPDAAGRLHSKELGLWLSLEDDELVMFDDETGRARLLTEAEAERAAREAAEAEVQRLREVLRRLEMPD